MKLSPPHWQKLALALHRRAKILAVLCLLGLALPLLRYGVPLPDTLRWLLDLAGHWQQVYAVGLVLCAAYAGWQNRHWLVLLPFAGLPLLTAAPMAPTAAAHMSTSGAPVLRVVSANLHLDNTDPQPLARWLAQVQADVVVLVELSPGFGDKLHTIPGYPYRATLPRDDPFGLGVLSLFPLHAVQTVQRTGDTPLLRLQVQWPGNTLHLSALHPMPPISSDDVLARDAMLRREAQHMQQGDTPALLVGDLNASIWSGALGANTPGLQPACGLAPTWPAALGGWLGIAIDQVLVSRHWQVVQCSVGPAIGSDHLPLLAVVQPMR